MALAPRLLLNYPQMVNLNFAGSKKTVIVDIFPAVGNNSKWVRDNQFQAIKLELRPKRLGIKTLKDKTAKIGKMF